MTVESRHTSIQSDSNVLNYCGDSCKYYYLPLFSQTLFSPIVEQALGAKNPDQRTMAQIRESVLKAKAARYSHVKIPYDRNNDPLLGATFAYLRDQQLGVVLQVCTSFLFDEDFFETIKADFEGIEIEWIVDQRTPLIDQRLIDLEDSGFQSHLSVVVHKDLDWTNILGGRLFEKFNTLHLYFSYQLEKQSPFLNCKESHKVVGLLRKNYPQHSFLPPKGIDLWDHRARSDFDMEPMVYPCFQTQSKSPDVRYSIVIPTFNNQNHLRVVLKHLYRQDVGLDHFEVIVVDDGGTDETQALVMKLLRQLPEKMNFKYIFFQRHRKRVMGDSQYRAGISRNLGVKNSDGEILCFLDSDIIVPKTYLRSVSEGLETADALQAKRINLSQVASTLNFKYDKVDETVDCIPDEPYWEEFIKVENWDELPFNWKYVCTHSFSMRKDVFWKVGGLKKNYIFYGFEDTDLGYRLVKNGYKLKLLDVRVYHMFHENTRSEFLNLKSLRHSLLSRTAQIFYLHHLDEDIFENLLGFMEPEPTWGRMVDRIIRTLSLQFIWRSKPLVYKTVESGTGGMK